MAVLVGSEDAIEVQRKKLTLEKILELVVAIDQKLEGENITPSDQKISILLENIKADGNVVGLGGDTSSPEMRAMFEKSVDIKLKDIEAGGDVVGAKFNVNSEMEIKKGLSIETPFAEVKINPNATVILGKGIQKK